MPIQVTAQTPEAKITFRYEGKIEPQVIYKPYPSEFKKIKKVAKTKTTKTKFGAGYCTDYVARQTTVTWRGNANQWAKNAQAQGREVNDIPKAGSIVQTNESRIGHVAYVEAVDGNTITISEWNYAGRYQKTVRTMSVDDSRIVAFIH